MYVVYVLCTTSLNQPQTYIYINYICTVHINDYAIHDVNF